MAAYDFIFGAAGSGKSTYIYRYLTKEAAAHPDKHYYLFVPEQNTLKAQRELITISERHGMLNLDVLSFQLLFYRVLEELGIEAPAVLDDVEKALLIRKACLEADKASELKVYSKKLSARGFIEQIKSLLSELYQYRIDAEKLKVMEENAKSQLLKGKLSDIRNIYLRFTRLLAEKAVIPEEIPVLLLKYIERSQLLKDAVIVFDGYTGFTPVQLELLALIMPVAERVRFAVTIPEEEDAYRFTKTSAASGGNDTAERCSINASQADADKQNAFNDSQGRTANAKTGAAYSRDDITDRWWLSRKTIANIIDTASKAGIKQNVPGDLRLKTRIRAEEGISIVEAADPTDEIRALGKSLVSDAMERGIRFQRMAVIVSDPESYSCIIDRELRRAGIPFFMDDNRAALGTPPVELIRSALQLAINGYRYEDVMRFVKNPLSTEAVADSLAANAKIGQSTAEAIEAPEQDADVADAKEKAKQNTRNAAGREAADELDNLLRKTGKRGRRQIEELLQEHGTMRYVFRLDDELKSTKSASEKVDAILAFCEAVQLEERTRLLAERFREKGFDKEAAENERFAKLSLELLARIKEVLKDEKLSNADFIKLADAGFTDMKGGMIPETMDMVIIGDLKRSRLDDIDVLYIVGANDGLLPLTISGGGIFTDRERVEMEKLSALLPDDLRFELAPDDETDSCIQEFYLHLMMNKPNKRLIISYPRTDLSQKAVKPSHIIAELKAKVSFACTLDGEPATTDDVLTLFTGTIRKLNARDMSTDSMEKEKAKAKLLYGLLSPQEETRKRADMVLKAKYVEHDRDKLSENAARRLYNSMLSGSVSRIESYEQCPYRHFLDYGLRLKKRETFDIEALDIGNLYHASLDEVFKEVSSQGKNISELSAGELNLICDRAVEAVTADYGDKVFEISARNKFISERVRKITRKTIWVLREQLIRGDFKTLGTEIVFKLRDEQLSLTGKIDRVDYCEDKEAGKTYVKVIDYKTGSTAFDITKVINGLQLQLTAYMDAAMQETAKKVKSTGEIVPAGMFYYKVDDPELKLEEIKKTGSTDKYSKAELLTLNKLRMDGAVLNDSAAAAHIDHEALLAEEAARQKELERQAKAKTSKKKELPDEGIETKKPAKGGKNKSVVFTDASVNLSEEEFKNLISRTKERMKCDAGKILEGDINIEPYRYAGNTGCDYCSFSQVCGFDKNVKGFRYRNIVKSDEMI